MRQKYLVVFAALSSVLFTAGQAAAYSSYSRHVARWHVPRNYNSYYPTQAFGPGFVYAPNYAYILDSLYYDYMSSPAYGPRSRRCFWC
jgi:hypothetical protein